jgi:hypothetical protein
MDVIPSTYVSVYGVNKGASANAERQKGNSVRDFSFQSVASKKEPGSRPSYDQGHAAS